MATARRQLGYVSSLTTQTVTAGGFERRVKLFTATDSSYVVPSGVTYMVAHMKGGGAACTDNGTGGTNGDASSVAFTAGTQSANGGTTRNLGVSNFGATAAMANSGKGGRSNIYNGSTSNAGWGYAEEGQEVVVGGAVTAGQTLAITVGAGGTQRSGQNGAAGGSGYVWLEYWIPANPSKKPYAVRFTTTNSSYTVPADVTHMVATIVGGGGGVGDSGAGTGGSSSVAFASGTITAVGGTDLSYWTTQTNGRFAGANNTGHGGTRLVTNASYGTGYNRNFDGVMLVAGGDVTAGATLAVTVGAGGTAGTNGVAGGSGYVTLEFWGD